jgi:hypothetical protein
VRPSRRLAWFPCGDDDTLNEGADRPSLLRAPADSREVARIGARSSAGNPNRSQESMTDDRHRPSYKTRRGKLNYPSQSFFERERERERERKSVLQHDRRRMKKNRVSRPERIKVRRAARVELNRLIQFNHRKYKILFPAYRTF